MFASVLHYFRVFSDMSFCIFIYSFGCTVYYTALGTVLLCHTIYNIHCTTVLVVVECLMLHAR